MSEAWRSEKIRRSYDKVKPVAEHLRAILQAAGYQVELGGSLRRGAETVGDIDLVIMCDTLTPNLLSPSPDLSQLPVRWDRHGEKQAHGSIVLRDATELHVDVWAATEREWGAFLWFITGPKELNIHMRTLAKRKGMQLDQFGLWRKFTDIPDFPAAQMDDGTERGLANSLGFAYLEPTARQSWVEQKQAGFATVEHEVRGSVPKGKTDEDRPTYIVTQVGDFWKCTCPHYTHRTIECKHIRSIKEGTPL